MPQDLHGHPRHRVVPAADLGRDCDPGRPLIDHGCPLQAIVVAFGFDARTVASWVARAGRHGQTVQAHLVEQPRALGHVQADAIRVKTQSNGALSGWPWRSWSARACGWQARRPHRDLPLVRRLMARVRRCAASRPLLVCTDRCIAYGRAIHETFRNPVHTGKQGRPQLRPWRHLCIAQVVKRYAQRRVVDSERRIVEGTPARVETLQRRFQGDSIMNTADIERLNATFRERLASLTRRGRAWARYPRTVHHGMYVIGTVYHFCTPHASLAHLGKGPTPAMAAGITDHCWTVQELLSLHVPPPRWTPPTRRGRRSLALQRLMTRWCM